MWLCLIFSLCQDCNQFSVQKEVILGSQSVKGIWDSHLHSTVFVHCFCGINHSCCVVKGSVLRFFRFFIHWNTAFVPQFMCSLCCILDLRLDILGTNQLGHNKPFQIASDFCGLNCTVSMANRPSRRRRKLVNQTELNVAPCLATSRYDMTLPKNWTMAQLKAELQRNNVTFSNIAM